MQPPPSDAEIVAELLETEAVSDYYYYQSSSYYYYYFYYFYYYYYYYYSVEVADEPVKCPDKNKLFQVIETLQRFSLFLDKGDTIQSYASRIESQVNQYFAKKKKQASIRDFLNKK